MIAEVPNTSAEEVAAAAIRGRRAQPAWEALGFEGRADVMYALRYWVVQNRERMLDAIVAENGKTREDAMLAEVWYLCDSLGFWAKNAREVPGRRAHQDALAAPDRQEGHGPLPAARRGRRDRPVELPAHQRLRRRDPGADGRQRRRATSRAR